MLPDNGRYPDRNRVMVMLSVKPVSAVRSPD